MTHQAPLLRTLVLAAVIGVAPSGAATAQSAYSIRDVLSPGFPYSLVSAGSVDRIAWIENERGMRNVFTAAPPNYEPTRLTSYLSDDGIDLQSVQISDDGEIVTFIRGHAPNRDGWVANPSSDPRGAERVVWAVSTRGGNPWRVVEATDYALSSDGRWVLFDHDSRVLRTWVRGECVWRAPLSAST